MNEKHNGNILQENVLVLNQNYEPLSVCSVRRAVVLLFLGKAQLIERRDGDMVRSISRAIPVPSVVRLGFYIRVPQKRVLLTRKNIVKRDSHRCQYCGEAFGSMTVDHITPKIYGGRDSWENLVCACIKCNNLKGNCSLEEAGMRLLRTPKRPNHITFIQQFIGIADNRWKRYLFLD
ncbi:MAG: HNH endonuclease [candidate division Zixibacteria bacterium]|nr:HNH endonuclease [candidate division Zixibacteria bacterium]